MDKTIINRVEELEKKYPPMDFNVEDYIQEWCNIIEHGLHYSIRNRIQIPNYTYIDKNTLTRQILAFLTDNELIILINTLENA